jgi:hypothetical protein
MRTAPDPSSTQSDKWPSAIADAAADMEHRRARCELKLLACIAPIGRHGLAMAERAGIGIEHFQHPDARMIFASILVANDGGIITDRIKTALVCRLGLDSIDLWDPADCRPFIGAMRWGPGPLGELFFRMNRTDAEGFLPAAAADLIEIFQHIDRLKADASGNVVTT